MEGLERLIYPHLYNGWAFLSGFAVGAGTFAWLSWHRRRAARRS